ncbi:hypothetical protein Lal_00024656 [Lupinus albus]|nr:hypothetical protein Lal_00024656 [Lupinus albus]
MIELKTRVEQKNQERYWNSMMNLILRITFLGYSMIQMGIITFYMMRYKEIRVQQMLKVIRVIKYYSLPI